MSHLDIDLEKCVGCGKCVRICMKENIIVENRKAKETGKGCLECAHCVSSCPKGAIRLVSNKSGDDEGILSSIKSKPWFDGGMVTRDDLHTLISYMNDDRKCDIVVLEGKDLDDFMEDVWNAVNTEEEKTPVVKEWAEWRNSNNMGPNPVLWEGRQVLFIFADSPEDAFFASNRMKARGLDMGIRGFHSNVIMTGCSIDPSIVVKHMPQSGKKLYMAYVIGHGRRLIEPVVKPIFEPLKDILGMLKR